MNPTIALLAAMLPAVPVAQAQLGGASGLPPAAIPKVSGVFVIQTPREGVTAKQVMAIMPDEVDATVRLYLDGKIREWYSRGDGKGVVILVDAKSEDEARTIIETLPLERAQLMNTQYVPVGPLMPLRLLVGPGTQQ
jgi:hypothetical protein